MVVVWAIAAAMLTKPGSNCPGNPTSLEDFVSRRIGTTDAPFVVMRTWSLVALASLLIACSPVDVAPDSEAEPVSRGSRPTEPTASVTSAPSPGAFGADAKAAASATESDACATGVQTITETVLDEKVSYFATFSSHNQKVIQNQHGIFLSYVPQRYLIDGSGGKYIEGTSSTWRLLRSIDGGKTFSSIYQRSGEIAQAPALDTDDAGNVYLAYGLGGSSSDDARFYQFRADNDFQGPWSARIKDGGGGKFTLFFDRSRSQLYYFADVKSSTPFSSLASSSFYTLTPNGSEITGGFALRKGDGAAIEYPYLTMAGGTLVAAWTTQDNDIYNYRDIHVMLSNDGGRAWETLDGHALGSYIVSDTSGPVPRIDSPDESGKFTWLANMLHKNGKLHFMYSAASINRHHYQRIDLATRQRDVDLPAWKGEDIEMSQRDGFFATTSDTDDSPLFSVVADTKGRLSALVSRDNGSSWHDYAIGQVAPAKSQVLFVGGARRVTSDGYVIGAYTLLGPQGLSDVPSPASKLVFFKFKANCP